MTPLSSGPENGAPAQPDPGPRINRTDFLAAQRANRRNTVWLIVVLLLIGAIVGYFLGAALDTWTGPQAPNDAPTTATLASPLGLVFAAGLVGIGVLASAVTLAFGGAVVLGLTGAREVSRDEATMLHNVVEEMAIAAGLPKPRVTVIDTPALNAFATGMRSDNAAIGVTRGLLDSFTRDELQGVVGHEMGHILNMDTRYMTAVAILVGLIALVCDGARRMIWYGGMAGRGRDKRSRGGGILILVVFVFAILAPVAAQLVRFAVSRQREYLADATAVKLTRNPQGLIGALQKLDAAAQPFAGANRATQHMFIVNPFRRFGEDVGALWATHPSIELRIKRLQNLGTT